MKTKNLFRSFLSLLLAGFFSFSLVPLSSEKGSFGSSHLAPRPFSDTEQYWVDYVSFMLSLLMTSGVSSSELASRLNQEKDDLAVGSVKKAITDLKENFGIEVSTSAVDENVLEVVFSGLLYKKSVHVGRFIGVKDGTKKALRFSSLPLAGRAVVVTSLAHFSSSFKPLLNRAERSAEKYLGSFLKNKDVLAESIFSSVMSSFGLKFKNKPVAIVSKKESFKPKVKDPEPLDVSISLEKKENVYESEGNSPTESLPFYPEKISQSPELLNLKITEKRAEIKFVIPTKTLAGTPLTYSDRLPDVIVEAFTNSGKRIVLQNVELIIPDLLNPRIGTASFSSLELAPLTQTEEVFFTLKTAGPNGEYSSPSNSVSGIYFAALLKANPLGELGGKRWRRRAFSGEQPLLSENSKESPVIFSLLSSNEDVAANASKLWDWVNAYLRLEVDEQEVSKELFQRIMRDALKETEIYRKASQGVIDPEILTEPLLRGLIPKLDKITLPVVNKYIIEVKNDFLSPVLESSL